MTADQVRAIADAVLYEGYILWPYRASSLKNQQRFTFGGVYPPAHSARHPDDPCSMQTEVLLRGTPDVRLQVTVRLLQVVQRQVLDHRGEPCPELIAGGQRHLSWQEAVEREFVFSSLPVKRLTDAHHIEIDVAAGGEREVLKDGVGALVRSWARLSGEVRIRVVRLGQDLWQAGVLILNTTPFDGLARSDALTRTFCSTHTLLSVDSGEFVSPADPPPELATTARECRNAGTWPVLVGESGQKRSILSSPIILEDYPRVAPESPGDMFDGGEIDQLLILNILALTDEEKAEMAASDPRSREILERAENLTPDQLMTLHGKIRELEMGRTR